MYEILHFIYLVGRPKLLGTMYKWHALAEKSGGGTANRGTGIPGLYVANVGALCWTLDSHLYMPTFLWCRWVSKCKPIKVKVPNNLVLRSNKSLSSLSLKDVLMICCMMFIYSTFSPCDWAAAFSTRHSFRNFPLCR